MTTTEPSTLDRLPRWAPPAVFAVLTVLVFRRYLLAPPGSMLIGQDTIAAGIMMRSFFVDQFHALGRLPLWNPYLYGGVPTIEAGSGDILYPPAFALHMLMPLVQALAWKLILHVFLAGLSMYGCARAYGTSRFVALFVGAGWLLSANLVSLVFGGQDGKMYVITLFPAALGALVHALDRRRWVDFLRFGAIAGLLLMAHPQLAFYAWVALGLYALAVIIARRADGGRPLLRRLAGGGLSLCVALGVSAVVLLPMYRYLRSDSPRAGPGLGFETASSYALNPEEVVNFVVPDFSGVNDTYWGRNPLKHNVEYGGVVVLGLGLAALFGLRGDRRRLGLGLMAGLSLLYAMGATTPAFRLMYLTIPGLRNFRAPSLASFVALTAISVLAALLLERIFRDRHGREGLIAIRVMTSLAVLALLITILAQGSPPLAAWFAVFGATPRAETAAANLGAISLGGLLAALWCGGAAGVLLAWRRGLIEASLAAMILTALTAVDLLRVDSRYVQVAPYQQFFPADPGLEPLRSQLGPGERVLPLPGILPGGGPEGGYLATYRMAEVFGYHSNQLRWYDQLTRRAERNAITSAQQQQDYWLSFLRSPALKALSGRLILLPGQIKLPGLTLLGSNQSLALYRNDGALPGVAVIPRVVVEPDSTRMIALLWDTTFSVARTALVSSRVPGLDSTGTATGTARLLENGADSVLIEASSTAPAMLLISRTYHPSWQAQLDGRNVTPIRVDHALLGIPLSGGTHRVLLRYRPAIVFKAKRISMTAWGVVLLASLIAAALSFRAARRSRG
jgi:hypothetical protein